MKIFGFEIRRLKTEQQLVAAVAVSSPEPKEEPKPEPKKTQKVKCLVSNKGKLNVKKAMAKVSFEDGSHFNFVVYGHFMPQIAKQQSKYSDSFLTRRVVKDDEWYDAYAHPHIIVTAEAIVQQMMMQMRGGQHQNFVDDQKKPKQARAGVPKSMKLVKVVDCFVETDILSVEERELEV